MFALPCHVLGNPDGGFYICEQHPIPILFESSMGPFDWVVLAVVRRVICEADAHPVLVCELDRPLDELRAPAAVFGTIVLVDHQCRRAVVCLPFGPVLLYAIPYIVARYFRLCKGDK